MDAALDTHDASRVFIMRNVEVFSDGSGGVCALEIVSPPFSARDRFYFDTPALTTFIEQLANIERTLVGEARLGQQFEEPYVLFRGNGRGHINVSGLLIDQSEHGQKLEFSLTTDQTALGSLIAGLREVTDARAA